jgi:hypothetical protein
VIDQRFLTGAAYHGQFYEIDAFPEFAPDQRPVLAPHGRLRDEGHAYPALDHRELGMNGVGVVLRIGTEARLPAGGDELIMIAGGDMTGQNCFHVPEER